MAAAGRSFYLIVYDIVDDKRRLKIFKTLTACGERVQRSAFECYLTPKELQTTMAKLKKYLKPEEDSLRIYGLCEACRPKLIHMGQGKITDPPGLMIV